MKRRNDWLIGQLPMGMLDDDFFVRFVSLFQQVATTFLDDADNIANIVDVHVAPPELVRWLGSWLGVTSIDASLPEDLQRRLVKQTGRTLAWRGTHRGLSDFLETVTGAPAQIEESGAVLHETVDSDRIYARRVNITVQSLGWLAEGDFVQLVADEIPANVAWTLQLGEQQIYPAVLAAPERG